MGKTNGKTEVENPNLDLEHELPASDDTGEEQPSTRAAGPVPQPAVSAEVERLKAERDTLLDRLARLQAEFENARKRAAREQQEYREYALADAVKALLPILDSIDRAVETAGPMARPKLSRIGSNARSEEHTSELQSRGHLVCRLLL